MTTPYYTDDHVTLWHGDALDVLRDMPDGSLDSCVTSPPYYGLRDYGQDGQYGLEASPAEYVDTMRTLFAEVRRVLADDGTLWLNLGDSYVGSANSGGAEGRRVSGSGNGAAGAAVRIAGIRPKTGAPPKNLLGIPWQVAFALQDDGWILRNDIIWSKPNAMPESVTDRLSTRYEHVFLFSKSRRYWFDLDPIREPHVSEPGREGANFMRGQKAMRPVGANSGSYSEGGRNPGDVWEIATRPFSGAHFAVMPLALAERCVLAGCKPSGTVLDPFSGSGTTGLAATKHGRRYVGIDLSAEYLNLSLKTRLQQGALDFGGDAA
ncbi:MAG TPA: site-specific DNA-methyltransferase [Acidothermaceae bacterium]